jgi:hypothetical protein
MQRRGQTGAQLRRRGGRPEVSRSCACIGSPCLRRGGHGASIGGGAERSHGPPRHGHRDLDELLAQDESSPAAVALRRELPGLVRDDSQS